MNKYDLLIKNEDSTIVSEYIPLQRKKQNYQSEKKLKDNLRKQIEKLNNYNFSDDDSIKFYSNKISNKNDEIIGFTDENKLIEKYDKYRFIVIKKIKMNDLKFAGSLANGRFDDDSLVKFKNKERKSIIEFCRSRNEF